MQRLRVMDLIHGSTFGKMNSSSFDDNVSCECDASGHTSGEGPSTLEADEPAAHKL